MSELIFQLGINGKLLLAQVVSFLLLFSLLRLFVYKPLAQFLAKRTKVIGQGLEDAEFARQEREKLKVLRAQLTSEAQKEAQGIIADAQAKGQKEFDVLLQGAKTKKEALVKDAKREIQAEKERALTQARVALGELVILASEKVLREKVDAVKDREIVARALREINA